MRQEPEFFEDRPIVLVYIGKRLSESKEVEDVLAKAGIDLTDLNFWNDGLAILREMVDEEERIAYELYPDKF